jgi:pimeloyl-ACP methyl ester carboxylesterase
MPTVDFHTSFGTIPIAGEHNDRPKVLAINGLGAAPDEMSRLGRLVAPHYDGVVGFLPGDRNPALSETSISAFALAFDEVVDKLGPTVVLGLSVGALVALGMRSRRILAVVAVDPPLMTAKLWPLASDLRAGLGTHHRAMVENVMGMTDEGFEGRDYSGLLNGLHRPTDVLVGEDPLYPERAISRMPSLVDEPERALLAAHPLVTLHVASNAGHNIPAQAPQVLLPLLRRVRTEDVAADG